eukprot:scaffold107051_cov48-Phaeocystis_antarctica.AAC.1
MFFRCAAIRRATRAHRCAVRNRGVHTGPRGRYCSRRTRNDFGLRLSRCLAACTAHHHPARDAERRCCLDPTSGATSNPEPASALMRLLPSAPLPALWPTPSLPLR